MDSIDFKKLRENIQICTAGVNRKSGNILTDDECQDVVQDVLVFFIEKCQDRTYDCSRQTPEGYLYWQIVGHVQKRTRIKVRQKGLPEVIADDWDDEGCVIVQTDDLFEVQPDVFNTDSVNTVLKLISNNMRESDRMIFNLLVDETSNQEMAEIFNLRLGTMNKRIFDARKRLKLLLFKKDSGILLPRVA